MPCFSADFQEGNDDYDESLIPDSNLEPGVLPTEIRKLVQSRRQVRQLMKAADVTQDQYLQVFIVPLLWISVIWYTGNWKYLYCIIYDFCLI